MASMNCLVCGHKLAIFRKLSLGDFCCQEHRSVFIQEQGDPALARLMEAGGEPKSHSGGTRVYAQFLLDELPARQDGPESVGYGPLTSVRMFVPPIRMFVPDAPAMSFTRLASARHTECIEPKPGSTAPVGFGMAGISLRLPGACPAVWNNGSATTHLRAAGLILPWSTGAASQTVFSLAPLAAAAWAQSGFCKPITATCQPAGAV